MAQLITVIQLLFNWGVEYYTWSCIINGILCDHDFGLTRRVKHVLQQELMSFFHSLLNPLSGRHEYIRGFIFLLAL